KSGLVRGNQSFHHSSMMRQNNSVGQIAGFAFLAFAFLCSSPPLVAQGKAPSDAPRQVRQYTIEQFMKTVRIGGGAFSPDDKEILFFNNSSGIFNAYSVAVAGGNVKQLTHSTKESTFSVDYLPDGRFLYRFDRGGNENEHLYVVEKGQERDLTPGEKLKANFI